MWCYLSKKIAMPNGVNLCTIAWNTQHGWICCGGEGGTLKVLKLESASGGAAAAAAAAAAAGGGGKASNLSMNQTLDGHDVAVVCATWNEDYRKLTTSDQNGLIIVWMLHKGMWFEEMINNRNKSTVSDMRWTPDGKKICIIYEDGAVIVGSVDGNRLWGKEMNHQLKFVSWAPDSRSIIFVTQQGEVQLYDGMGNFINTIPILALKGQGAVPCVGCDWYDGAEGYFEPECPTLALGFENGFVQIMRHEGDEAPVVIDTQMAPSAVSWNNDGSVLAVAGAQPIQARDGSTKNVAMVQFYSPLGTHKRTQRVPSQSGNGIRAIAWEGLGLRIALAVDSFIYFANIRPDYRWGYFGKTLVYAFAKADRSEQCVVFWDTSSGEKYSKNVKNLHSIRADGENCVLAKPDEGSSQFILILCNAIGSPVDTKYIDIQPLFIAMTKYHVVAASEDAVYVWQYSNRTTKLTSSAGKGSGLQRKGGRERLFHIDDIPSGAGGTGAIKKHKTSDPICCVAASETCLVVGRQSGGVVLYTLPHISLEHKFQLRCRPQIIALNCDSSRMSVIDINGILSFFDLTAEAGGLAGPVGQHLEFERKDVWDMRWADDNPELLALMEKTRMYIYRGLDPQEPVTSNGYLCSFDDLQIKAVQLDDIMRSPDHPEREYMLNFETKSLRDARTLLAESDLKSAYQFVEDNPHPRLWRLIAETALDQLDFDVADQAFVACEDFQGIRFVKRLRVLDDKAKRKAEVAAYFKRFDEAEAIYREIDRKDLAIELRMRLGDWFRVVQLVQSGAGDDKTLTFARNKIGDYYSDRQKWQKAVQFYQQSQNAERLVECYYALDNFVELEGMIQQLPEGSPLLANLGEKFSSVGMSENAVQSYLRAGDIKAAIDTCVVLQQWDRAIELAEEFKFPAIDGLLTKYANHLLGEGKTVSAIELYRKAGRSPDTARLLVKLATEARESHVNPARIKKLYVLAAVELEVYKNTTLAQQSAADPSQKFVSQTQQTLDNLMTVEAATGGGDASLEMGWRGAEAYHLYALSQRQLFRGDSAAAMNTALRMVDYEDALDVEKMYCVIAMTTCNNGHFGQCSQAFTKLETLESLSPAKKTAYADLALQIFTRNPPHDPPLDRASSVPCPHCEANVPEWASNCPKCSGAIAFCVASGRALTDGHEPVYTCKGCRHRAYTSELQALQFCALCHVPLVKSLDTFAEGNENDDI